MTQTAMDIETRPLPAGWKWVRLGDVIEVISGRDAPPAERNSSGDGMGYLRGPVDFGIYKAEVSQWVLQPRAVCKPMDTLLAVKGSVGKINLAPDQEVSIGRDLMALRNVSDRLDFQYLYWFLANNYKTFQSMSQGATVPGLSRKHIQDLSLPLAPLEEQKRIAAILNEQMATVEKATKAAEERLEAAKALPAAYLREVFEGEDAKEWEEYRFGDIVSNHDGKRIPVKQTDRLQMSGEYPYYGASGIIDYVDDFLFEGQHLLIGEDGANLLMRSSLIAFLADGKFWVNNHAHVLTAIPPFNNQFLAYAIESMDLSPYVAGSAQPKLTQGKLNNIVLRLPDNSMEIEQLTSSIEDHITYASLLVESIQQELEAIEAMPSALIRKAFSGEL